ncbi:MAG: family 16 glycosylhydrolase [Planctomycetota bacterium]
MRLFARIFLLFQHAVFCGAAVFADGDVAPGKPGVNEHDAWTRDGDLGELPTRISDALPLSDQSNAGKWTAYEPMTDEFTDPALDESKWLPRHRSWRGRQPAWFSPANVQIRDEQLQLIMKRDEPPEDLRERGYHTYSSAAVQSVERVRYGYFEVRAQPMASAGSSSFWFAGSGDGWRTEIDVFELGGKAIGFEHRYNMNLHVFATPTEQRHWNVGDHWLAPWQFAEQLHVYGLDWNDREIVYYVDGVAVRRVENTHWHQPIYMIFDSETMPNWLGMPKDEDLPSIFKIDYVRTWKRAAMTPEVKSSGLQRTEIK